MEENKNFEDGKKVPGMNNENVEQTHEQQLGKGIEKLESGLAGLDSLKQAVGGDQGIRDTIAKMSPEEKQNIVDRIKKTIKEKMGSAKPWALAGGAFVLGIALEYLGVSSLNESVSQVSTDGQGLSEAYLASVAGLMVAEAVAAVTAFGVAAVKALETIKDRVQFLKVNKQEIAV